MPVNASLWADGWCLEESYVRGLQRGDEDVRNVNEVVVEHVEVDEQVGQEAKGRCSSETYGKQVWVILESLWVSGATHVKWVVLRNNHELRNSIYKQPTSKQSSNGASIQQRPVERKHSEGITRWESYDIFIVQIPEPIWKFKLLEFLI